MLALQVQQEKRQSIQKIYDVIEKINLDNVNII